MEGSVDEDSTKSDEEYDDLAMQDGLDNGCWSDDAKELDNAEEQTSKEPKKSYQ